MWGIIPTRHLPMVVARCFLRNRTTGAALWVHRPTMTMSTLLSSSSSSSLFAVEELPNRHDPAGVTSHQSSESYFSTTTTDTVVDYNNNAMKEAHPTFREHTGTCLLIGAEEHIEAEFHLTERDFPKDYVNMCHPEDGITQTTPIMPEYIHHGDDWGHFRMLVRISFRLGENAFVPYTFVCDTGAPRCFYLSPLVMNALDKAGRLETDDELGILGGTPFLTVAGRQAAVYNTPRSLRPANIIGLRMLERLGLQMSEGSFVFSAPVEYL